MDKIYLFGEIDCDVRRKICQVVWDSKLEIVDDPYDAEIILSIGGDGTILRAASLFDKPIAGIHNGTLGFLTVATLDNIKEFIEDVSNGYYVIEVRQALEAFYQNEIPLGNAVNDIVISKTSTGIIRFKLVVDDIVMDEYAADGIVISTATGASGYGLSCGGPFIHPACSCIEVTFIAPHTVMNRSIILPCTSNIVVEIQRSRDANPNVQVDGKMIRDGLPDGSIISIKKSEKTWRLINMNNSFIQRIREKL